MSEFLTLKEAIKFIVERVIKPDDKDQRAWENLIRTRFNRGVTKENEKYSLNDVLAHARKCYGLEPFKDFPLPAITGSISSYANADTATIKAFTYSLPNKLEECQALIGELNNEIYQLKQEIKDKEDVIAGLRPDAERYRKNCATNQNNARKTR